MKTCGRGIRPKKILKTILLLQMTFKGHFHYISPRQLQSLCVAHFHAITVVTPVVLIQLAGDTLLTQQLPHSHIFSRLQMSETTNEMIAPLEKDERLSIIERRSPIFSNRVSHQNSKEQHVLGIKDPLPPIKEDWEPCHQKRRVSFEMHRSMTPNPIRRVERRNSKTAAMMVASAASTFSSEPRVSQEQHQRYQRRNSVVETTLFPLTKSSFLPRRISVDEQSSFNAVTKSGGPSIPDNFNEEMLRHRLRTSLGISSSYRGKNDTQSFIM